MERISPATLPSDERESLEEWLDYHRATLLMKCEGLAPADLARASCPPSPLTSLRWVYQHMIEEYARHNGHADLIRERIDGVVGD